MCRQVILIIFILSLAPSAYCREAAAIVVDAADDTPLPKASTATGDLQASPPKREKCRLSPTPTTP